MFEFEQSVRAYHSSLASQNGGGTVIHDQPSSRESLQKTRSQWLLQNCGGILAEVWISRRDKRIHVRLAK